MRRSTMALWGHGHLPLLARARSKDSVEYILQALWRTRRTGLDAADRAVLRDMLQIPSDADADLDPLLVCLRSLIRTCVHHNIAKDQIPNLFPHDVLPELQTLLTLLLHKFQPHWQHDALNDQLQLHSPTESPQGSSQSGHKQVNLQLAKDSLDQMLKDMYPIKDQVSNDGSANGNEDIAGGT